MIAPRVGRLLTGVSVRDVEKAASLSQLGVRVRRGDFGDAPSLVSAFDEGGADHACWLLFACCHPSAARLSLSSVLRVGYCHHSCSSANLLPPPAAHPPTLRLPHKRTCGGGTVSPPC